MQENTRTPGLISHFEHLIDPRIDRQKDHLLKDIVFIALAAVLAGADDWVAIEAWAKEKIDWLKERLELANGIPSHDTFGRVFAKLDPEQFEKGFLSWISSISNLSKGEVVAIDGKTLRRSHDSNSSKAAIHMVSAWANENRLILGQIKVDSKSNEITAIPELLEVLFIEGCLVTIDAMGCQKKIVEKITSQNADYLIALKANQGALFEQVKRAFEIQAPAETNEEVEKNHGRVEQRKCSIINDFKWLDQTQEWENLNCVVKIVAIREDLAKEAITQEERYYISSLDQDAARINKAVRAHWGIENSVHWCLDVAFREDDSRVRMEHSAQNLSVIRRIALNLLRNDKTLKVGIKNRRLKAAWSLDYLGKLMGV